MSRFRDCLVGVIKRTLLHDLLLKSIERRRGITYPDGLVGRQLLQNDRPTQGQVLVVAAHPDDETLGMGLTLIRHRAQQEHVTVVFTTNGAGDRWRDERSVQQATSTRRLEEACSALEIIGIPATSVICLGFPDGGLRRYVPEAARDIEFLMNRYHPRAVYVHAIEGGHLDHDFTSFIVQRVCMKLNYSDVYEWAEYNVEHPLNFSLRKINFPLDPYVREFTSWSIVPGQDELEIKHQMLKRYASQEYVMIRYPPASEVVRKAKPLKLLSRLKHFTNFSAIRLWYLRTHAIKTGQ